MKHPLINQRLSRQAVAELLGFTPRTISNWKSKGHIRGQRRGRQWIVDPYSLLRYLGNVYRPDPRIVRLLCDDYGAWTAEERQDAEAWEREHGVRNKARVELTKSEALEIIRGKRDSLARRDSSAARCESLIRLCNAGELTLPPFATWEVVAMYRTLRDARDMLKSQVGTLATAVEKALEADADVSVPPACIKDVSPQTLVEQTADAPVPSALGDEGEGEQLVRDAALLLAGAADEVKESFLDPAM